MLSLSVTHVRWLLEYSIRYTALDVLVNVPDVEMIETVAVRLRIYVDAASHLLEQEHVEAKPVMFHPSVELDSITHGFRIFAQNVPYMSRGLPSTRPPDPDHFPQACVVYTDGSCIMNGALNAKAGSGVWYGVYDTRNVSVPVPKVLVQSNAVGEMFAVHYSASTSPSRTMLAHVTDSRPTLAALTADFPRWEDRGWIGVKNRELVQSTVAVLRKRKGPTVFQWVKGHSGNVGNDGADELAQKAISISPEANAVVRLLPGGLLLPGAKLSSMTLRLLKETIRVRSIVPATVTCSRNLRLVQDAVDDRAGSRPTVPAVWKSLQHRDLSRNVRQWMWYALHGAYRLGRRWLHIPGCEARAFCEYCQREDSMAHILFQCDVPGREDIWKLARFVLEAKKIEWYEPTFGLVLGSPLIRLKSDARRSLPGSSRLFRIILSESAHLIWTLRCERVVENKNDPAKWLSRERIERLWSQRINERIHLDALLTSKQKFGKAALPQRLVLTTWSGTLQDEGALPTNWIGQPEFLVGICTSPRGVPLASVQLVPH
ncbi:hypothetical protein BDZ89DRAFT_1041743 [Hymenopellis radicata]|nr:hypothetical protein BDZ89DRAFT_1041743 [Hymenopellis radicata]